MDASELDELTFAKPSVHDVPLPHRGDGSAAARRSVEHFVAPLAVLGFASALLVCASNGVNDEKAPKLRPTLAIILVLAGASLGCVLSLPAVRRRGRWLSALIAVVLGVAIAEALAVSFGQEYLRAALVGLIQAVIFLPSIWVVTHAAAKLGRAGVGSLLDRSNRRAVWAATAVSVAVGYSAVELLPLFTLRRSPEDVGYVCFAMAILASLGLAVITIADLAALRRLKRRVRMARAADETGDGGVRDEAYEVRNQPERATTAMTKAVIRSLSFAVLAWAGVAAPFVIPRIPHREAFVRVRRESFTAQTIAPSGAGASASASLSAPVPDVPATPIAKPSAHLAPKFKKKKAHEKKPSKKNHGD